ncbi:DUF421 domain-containing protein [Thalassobacillus devorans]|uniref:DUF421 domain-containing protein n=1 Tax=Thalassobacillus devorans TaxID=279813 RepID=UPI00048C0E4B
MSVMVLILRLALAFITLLALTRLMGRKEISQMTFFNFISAISIGTIGASLAIDSTLSVRNGLIALIAWSAFTIALGYLDIKSKPVRTAIEGQPLIVIRNGKIMENELRKTRLDMDALHVLLRKKNVFSVSDVDYAIFETDGTLSVLKHQAKQPLTKGDSNTPLKTANISSIPTAVINDGKVNSQNLKKLDLDQKWLDQQLKGAGITSVADVFYAEIQKDGSLYIDTNDDVLH